MGKPGTLEKTEQQIQNGNTQNDAIVNEAVAAWSQHSRNPKIDRMETMVDDKIKDSKASEQDQKVMKTLSHALAEGDVNAIDKVVKAFANHPQDLARIAKEMDDVMLKTGLKVGVSFNAKDKVMEFDDRTENHRLMVPTVGKPMGNDDGVHYDDYDKSDKDFNRLRKPYMEEQAGDVSKSIAKDMVKKFGQRKEEQEIQF
jgi:hypothetical protein